MNVVVLYAFMQMCNFIRFTIKQVDDGKFIIKQLRCFTTIKICYETSIDVLLFQNQALCQDLEHVGDN